MPSSLSPGLKAGIRRLSRRLGYELVPFTLGFAGLQRQILSECDVAIDVGANVGQYAEKLRDLGFRNPIHSFEPNPQAFADLSKRSSKDPLWKAHCQAVSDQNGHVVLHVSANSVSSSLLEVQEEHLSAEPSVRPIRDELVEATTLDAALSEVSGENLWIKLDVQGHELAVLNGSTASLRRCRAVQVELSFGDLYAGQGQWTTVCNTLRDAGFVLRHLELGFEDGQTGYLQQADGLFLK